MQTVTRKSLNWLTLILLLICASRVGLAADSRIEKAYRAGYEAGYKAAMEEFKKSAESKTTAAESKVTAAESPPAAASTVAAGRAGTPAKPATSLTTEATPPESAAGPPDWWNHSALLYPTLDDHWRHHFEVQLSGGQLSGNESGYIWRGGGKWFSRKGSWTNEMIVDLDMRDIEQVGGGVNSKDYRMFQDSLRYDLTDQWYVAGGFIWEHDETNLIGNRYTGIFGPGYYWVDNEKFRLNTYLGLGGVNESYMQFVQDYVGIDERSSSLLYFYETFEWRISKDWNFRQGFRWIQGLSKWAHYVLDPENPASGMYVPDKWLYSYRYVSSLNLDYNLSPSTVLTFSTENRYDSNPWPDVLSRDIVSRITFRFMF